MIVSPADESAVLVALANLASREKLFADMAEARVAAGLSVDVVAERLGVSSIEVLSIEAGREDLTLTELRHMGIAIGVIIDYSVHA